MARFSISVNSSSVRSTAVSEMYVSPLQRRDRRGKKPTLEVVLDTGWSDTLGQDANTPLDQPADQNIGSLSVVLLRNVEDRGVLSEMSTIGTSQWGIGARENVILLEPRDEFELGALNGKFDLVCKSQGKRAFIRIDTSEDVRFGSCAGLRRNRQE